MFPKILTHIEASNQLGIENSYKDVDYEVNPKVFCPNFGVHFCRTFGTLMVFIILLQGFRASHFTACLGTVVLSGLFELKTES